MFRLRVTLVLAFLFSAFLFKSFSFAQTKEIDEIKSAAAINELPKKVEALKQFIKDYPKSNYIGYAYENIFSSYLDMNEIDSAFSYIGLYLDLIPPEMRMNPYNDVAYTLAQKKVGLDSADVYSRLAVELAEKNNPRNLSMYEDTRALVLYDLGKNNDALALEEKAIAGHETDPTYLVSLSVYQEAAGKRTDALKTAATAIINGDDDEAITNFDKWISEEKTGAEEQTKLKEKIADEVLQKYFQDNDLIDKVKIHSIAGVFLAQVGVKLSQAEKWTKDAVASLKNNSDIEIIILYKKNLAIVYARQKKYDLALKELKSIEDLDNPWDFDFWYTLGNTYETLGQNKNAVDSYISGIIAFQNKRISSALNSLAKKEGISDSELQNMIIKKKDELTSFKPGHYDKKATGKVVLAELFTGAECGPCAAADGAFDALSEYFPRTDLAILEYHLHIPAPDPMTNPQTFQRYKFYGGNYGTPTVFFDGTEKLTGGGPRMLVQNRFNIYKYVITKLMDEKSLIKINGDATQSDSIVKISLNVKGEKNKNASLHLALVEKAINYIGGNGVDKHIFVVRHLIGSAEGIDLKGNAGKYEERFNLNEIQQSLTKYLDDPTTDPSWRSYVKFTGWRSRTDKINRNNLAVVAWVQDNSTKKILQSFYVDVPVLDK